MDFVIYGNGIRGLAYLLRRLFFLCAFGRMEKSACGSTAIKLPESLSLFATSTEEAERLRSEMEQTGAQIVSGRAKLDAIRSQIREVKNDLRQARSAGDQEKQTLLKAKIKKLRNAYREENSAQQAIMLEQTQKMQEKQLEQLRRNNPELADVNQKIMALQKQVVKASNNKDLSKMLQLSKELKSLKQQQKKAMAQRPNQATPSIVTGGSGQCPEHVVAWADELEKNGASNSNFRKAGHLANLFRPSVFEKHFHGTCYPWTRKSVANLVLFYGSIVPVMAMRSSAAETCPLLQLPLPMMGIKSTMLVQPWQERPWIS